MADACTFSLANTQILCSATDFPEALAQPGDIRLGGYVPSHQNILDFRFLGDCKEDECFRMGAQKYPVALD